MTKKDSIPTREQVTKCITYDKNVNDQWTAHLTMGDGFQYSVAALGASRIAKPRAREALLDKVFAQSEHPLPSKK